MKNNKKNEYTPRAVALPPNENGMIMYVYYMSPKKDKNEKYTYRAS